MFDTDAAPQKPMHIQQDNPSIESDEPVVRNSGKTKLLRVEMLLFTVCCYTTSCSGQEDAHNLVLSEM